MKSFTITFIDSTGLRVLYAPNLGNCTFKTKAIAFQRLKDIKANNSIDTINSVFGLNPQFKVMPVETLPNGIATQTVFN